MTEDEDLAQCLEMQLMEIEILQSIYSNENEFQIEDQEAMLDAKDYLNKTCKRNIINRQLGFIIKFIAEIVRSKESEQKDATNFKNKKKQVTEENPDDISNALYQVPLEILCRLPTLYPLKTPPEILVRSLKQNVNRKFTEELNNHIISSHTTECSILNIIEWVKDNIDRFIIHENSTGNKTVKQKQTFSRMFIYSHHIFSINKRRNIVDWAKSLNLNGFSMPGKPGIICVEGETDSVQEYWSKLRSLAWHKLQIKDTQTYDLTDDKQLSEIKKFDDFEEKIFSINNDSNIDLGQLFSFLKEKNLNYIFSMYFGVEGKTSNNSNSNSNSNNTSPN